MIGADDMNTPEKPATAGPPASTFTALVALVIVG